MVTEIKLTDQEVKMIKYLEPRHGQVVAWEELAQFAKEPSNVKLKTMQRAISEIKKKYKDASLPVPFNVNFSLLAVEKKINPAQTLVQVKRTPSGNTMIVNKSSNHAAHIDFALDRNTKAVRTKSGLQKLNDDEWDMLKYFHANVGRIIKISELRDKVKYPLYGSKLPARWFDAIMRIVNNLRRAVPGLSSRLLTTNVDGETSYLFQ